MRIIKKLGWLILVIIIVAQFFGPDKNQGDINDLTSFFEDTNPPEVVTLILKETCFDCHSSFTRYPWYNNITPVNYWMDGHIDHARSHLDFSNWTEYDTKKKDHKLEELLEWWKPRKCRCLPIPGCIPRPI